MTTDNRLMAEQAIEPRKFDALVASLRAALDSTIDGRRASPCSVLRGQSGSMRQGLRMAAKDGRALALVAEAHIADPKARDLIAGWLRNPGRCRQDEAQE